MVQEPIYDLFVDAMSEIVTDIATLLPKIILTIIVLIIAFLAIRLLNIFFKRLLELVNLDGIFKTLVKTELPFSLSNLIIILIDAGIILIAIFGLSNIFFDPSQMELIRGIFEYALRILSIIAVTILWFMMFDLLIERVSTESRLRGYILFILLIIVTMMIVDLTALSQSTKSVMEQGLSIGLAITVGVFAIWFFFHDYLDKLIDLDPSSHKRRRENKK
ncbi:MAG: hypothetical protein O2U61_03125 [Candidatus Bathyarchaeota archaeon]|nr:hypothetical protein [Candidatus Bathyarchaeota archaeon]MCZ2845479.1 hypothetical protein [Candidatus Bathyarchaeota archaeon]